VAAKFIRLLFNGHFPGKLQLAGCQCPISSFICCGREPVETVGTGNLYAGRISCHPASTAKALKETLSTDPKQWPRPFLSYHLQEGVLLPLHFSQPWFMLNDASTY